MEPFTLMDTSMGAVWHIGRSVTPREGDNPHRKFLYHDRGDSPERLMVQAASLEVTSAHHTEARKTELISMIRVRVRARTKR